MSLKIIPLVDDEVSLTVDSDLISVDNDIITADMTNVILTEYTLKIPYRRYATNVDLYLWNEIKEVETIIPIVVEPEPGLMVLNFIHPFLDGETYEVKVLDQIDNSLVWRGKILATIQTDLQNYKLHKVVTNNIIKI